MKGVDARVLSGIIKLSDEVDENIEKLKRLNDKIEVLRSLPKDVLDRMYSISIDKEGNMDIFFDTDTKQQDRTELSEGGIKLCRSPQS